MNYSYVGSNKNVNGFLRSSSNSKLHIVILIIGLNLQYLNITLNGILIDLIKNVKFVYKSSVLFNMLYYNKYIAYL